MNHVTGTRPRAFTVVELLVVVAIIALLVAILIVGLDKARNMARVAGCLSNQRQHAFAQSSYAVDNGGAYASPRTSGSSTTITYAGACGPFSIRVGNGSSNQSDYHSWTASHGAGLVGGVEYQFGINSTNPAAKALSGGRLWPYLGTPIVYISPFDDSGRLRSYSLNGFIGVSGPADSPNFCTSWAPWFCSQGVTPRDLVSTHVKHVKDPAHTLCSVVEHDPTDGLNYNQQTYLMDPRPPAGYPAPQGAPNPAAWGTVGGWSGWIDSPAFWDPFHITYSHYDGSTEAYSMQNTKLPGLIFGPPGAGYGPFYPQPADDLSTGPWRRDFAHFRDKLFPGVFPPLMPRYRE